MTTLDALNVVEMDEVLVGVYSTKQITLREEFNWLFSEEFYKLRQGFNPVDTSEYDAVEEVEDNDKKTIFIKCFQELEENSQDRTVSGNDLRWKLISTGKFYQSDALHFVQEMMKVGEIQVVPDRFDVYRRNEQV